MPTRRRTLALAGGLLGSLAGCLESGPAGTDAATPTSASDGSLPASSTVAPASSPTATPTAAPAGTPTVAGTERSTGTDRSPSTRTDSPDAPADATTVSGDLPAWEADRWIETDYSHVLGLDAVDGRVYATLNTGDGDSAVAAIAPGTGEFAWTTTARGDPEAGSHVHPEMPTETWGVTVADGTVYSVHGRGDSYEWTELHALNGADGERRWSVRRERSMAVHGVLGDTVVASGREFFEPEGSHDTPEEPLETVVYGLDAESGDQRWARVVTGARGVAAGSDSVCVAHGDALTVLDGNGDRQWDRRMDDGIRGLAIVDSTVVVVVGSDVDASTLVGLSTGGEEAWGVETATRYLVPHGDRVYAMDDAVTAVTSDGAVVWRQRVPGHDPLLTGDFLYTRTATRMNAVDAFDLPGGERRFRFETPSNNGWPLGATDRTLVAEAITPDQAEFTSLFAVDADTGEPRAVYRPSETVFAAQGYDGAAYVGFGGGRVGVFGDVL